MPYITKGERALIDHGEKPHTLGQLNYSIMMTISDYLHITGVSGYAPMNNVMGVLSCVQQEFYRRKMVPYEEKKMAENGDI